MLTDLADACRASGLRVVEVPGWRTRGRPSGGFAPRGVLCHHTGSKDTNPESIADDRAYADWLAKIGRSDLPAPLCQLALDRTGTVYVCAAGRGNHAGKAKAVQGVPAGDGNTLWLGIEAHNTGSEGWDHPGTDAAGNRITQREAYVRLVAALCRHYRWDAVAGHKETSTTGKWDPGKLDMDDFRADVARAREGTYEGNDTVSWTEELTQWHPGDRDPKDKMTAGQQLNQARGYAQEAYRESRNAAARVLRLEKAVAALGDAFGEEVGKAVREALAEAVVDVEVTVKETAK